VQLQPDQGLYLFGRLFLPFQLLGFCVLHEVHIDIVFIHFANVKTATFAVRDFNLVVFAQHNIDTDLFSDLSAGTLHGSLSLVNFTFGNTKHTGGFVRFYQ
jgi:hypothetical protein